MLRAKPLVLVIGSVSSGKSVVVGHLGLSHTNDPGAWRHLLLERAESKNLHFVLFDPENQANAEAPHILGPKSIAVVLVVDTASSEDNLKRSGKNLQQVLTQVPSKQPVLVLACANVDCQVDLEKVKHALQIGSSTRRWRVQPCVPSTGEGVFEAFDWLLVAARAPGYRR